MSRPRASSHLAIVLLCAGPLAAAEAPSALTEEQRTTLSRWYASVGDPLPEESFGHYLARSARVQHGAGYEEAPAPPGPEELRVDLDRFECVSFIESSLAVARCGYRGQPDAQCFTRELTLSRYREGRLAGYPSRLHYFVDWIGDNAARGRLVDLTRDLGGAPLRKDFFHISARVLATAALPDAELAPLVSEMTAVEKRLSRTDHFVLDRERAPSVLTDLADGDLVAFVRERSGLLVHHAGFVFRVGETPRLLHASSYHGRVVITASDLTDYLLRRPERRGVIVARPLAPPAP